MNQLIGAFILGFLLIFNGLSCKNRSFMGSGDTKSIHVTRTEHDVQVRMFWIGQATRNEDPNLVYSAKCKKTAQEQDSEPCTEEIVKVPLSAFASSLLDRIELKKVELKSSDETLELRQIQVTEQGYAAQFASEMTKPNLSKTLAAALAVHHARLEKRIEERQERLSKLIEANPESLRELEAPEALQKDLLTLLNKSFTVKYQVRKSSIDSSSALRAELIWSAFFSVSEDVENSELEKLLAADLLEVASKFPIKIKVIYTISFERKKRFQPIKSVPAALIGNFLFVSLGYPEVLLSESFGGDKYLKTSVSDIVFGKSYCRMEAEMKADPATGHFEYAEPKKDIYDTYGTIPSFENPEHHLVFQRLPANKYSLETMEKFYLSCGIADEGAELFKDGKINSQNIDFGLFGENRSLSVRDFASGFHGTKFEITIGNQKLN